MRALPLPEGALSPQGTARRWLAPFGTSGAGFELAPENVAMMRDAGLGDEAIYLAWQVAAWPAGITDTDRSALAVLCGRSLAAVAQGSTRMRLADADRALLAKVPEIAGAPGERKPLIVLGAYLYHQKLLACEDRLVTALAARLGRPGPFPVEDVELAMAAAVATAPPRPSDEQHEAVRAALGHRLAVVSGGPGTGKTTIVLAVVRALLRLGVPTTSIALAAPTGKAANRLAETVRNGVVDAASAPAAETLHRLLGFSPGSGRFSHHENNRLAQAVVIVDESSMIDLVLMERLVRSLRDDAILILLGDADQLPSIDAGAVFRDLASLGVRLSRNFRMDPDAGAGRHLLKVAHRVNAGEAAVELISERDGVAALTYEGVEIIAPTLREALLQAWYADRIATRPELEAVSSTTFVIRGGRLDSADEARLAALHAAYQRFRILGVTRGRPTGVDAINTWLHGRHGASTATLLPGEPVVVLRNDYDRGLFNGDQGVVVRVREPGRPPLLAAAFIVAGRFVSFELDGLRDAIALSYAMTVHKAQGSEFDDVAVVLPEAPLPLLSRELLYTALTRSRRSVVLCGSAAVLAAAVAASIDRSCGLREKLGAHDHVMG